MSKSYNSTWQSLVFTLPQIYCVQAEIFIETWKTSCLEWKSQSCQVLDTHTCHVFVCVCPTRNVKIVLKSSLNYITSFSAETHLLIQYKYVYCPLQGKAVLDCLTSENSNCKHVSSNCYNSICDRSCSNYAYWLVCRSENLKYLEFFYLFKNSNYSLKPCTVQILHIHPHWTEMKIWRDFGYGITFSNTVQIYIKVHA